MKQRLEPTTGGRTAALRRERLADEALLAEHAS